MDEPKEITLKVIENQKTNAVRLEFNNDDFKHWQKILGVLEAAKHTAQMMLMEGFMQSKAQAAASAIQVQQIKNRLKP